MAMQRLSLNHLHGVAVILFFLLTDCLIPTATARSSPLALAVTGEPHCSNLEEWRRPNFNPLDCLAASERFIWSDYSHFGLTRFEFLNRGTPRSTRLSRKIAPRRYSIGSCSVIIAMLWNIPDQPPLPPLPGNPQGPFIKTDVLSFQEVFEAVRRICITCVEMEYLGWELVGQDHSVGVFVMARGSELEINIPIGVGLSSMVAGISLNFTNPFNASGILGS